MERIGSGMTTSGPVARFMLNPPSSLARRRPRRECRLSTIYDDSAGRTSTWRGAMATAPAEPRAAGQRTSLPAEGTPADELRRVMETAAAGDLDWLTRMATGTN